MLQDTSLHLVRCPQCNIIHQMAMCAKYFILKHANLGTGYSPLEQAVPKGPAFERGLSDLALHVLR